MGQSEVARIRKQIELEYQSAQQVFTGFTPTARHDYIIKRQENIEGYFQELKQHVSTEEAVQVIIEAEYAVDQQGKKNGR